MTEQEAMDAAYRASPITPKSMWHHWQIAWQAALQWAAEGQEPVAWMSSRNGFIGKQRTNGDYDVPLYVAPVPDFGPTDLMNALCDFERNESEEDELRAELSEQCRIIGMGAERELSLLAEVERLRKALDVVVARTKFVHPGEATWRLCVISNIANAALAKGE